MDVILALRRSWRFLVAGAVAAAMVANIVAARTQPTYDAQARLLVGPINADRDTLLASGQLARTYAELATSRPVLESAIASARASTTAQQLAKHVTTTSNDVNRIVTISVEDTGPQTAATLAEAIAVRLRELSASKSGADIVTLDALRRQPEIASLSPRVRADVQTAANRVLQQTAGRIEIVEPAARPTNSSGPRVGLLTVLAALAGLIVAGIAVYLRALSAGHAGDRDGVVLPRGMPDLGLVEVPRPRSPRALAVLSRPDSVAAERYRLLVAKLGLLRQDPLASAIVVADTEDGWPGAVVAANVAAVLAEAGRSVLVIDAAGGPASVSALHDLEDSSGYSELVRDPDELDGAIGELVRGVAPRLRILPQGRRPVGLLSEELARALLDTARAIADIVVIAAAPMQHSTAALAWGPIADGTVLVGELAPDADHRMEEAAEALSLVHAQVIGGVIARRTGWDVWAQPMFAPDRAAAETRGGAPDEPTSVS
jgi:receptor protein-tyrosine kinase